MARYSTRENQYEIVAQARLTTRKLTKLSTQLNIPLRTLKSIVAEPQFKKVFDQLKFELMDDARLEFRNNVDPAFKIIIKIMNDEYVAPAVRLAAACKVIEYGLDADAVERFEERLTKLETKTIEAVSTVAADNWVDNNASDYEVRDESQQDRTFAA